MYGLLYRLAQKLRSQDPFSAAEFRQAQHDRIMRLPQAKRRYAILFTPRSGSSRLTELAEASGVLGHPDECFNPSFTPTMAYALSAQDLSDYITLLTHRRHSQGTFGCQLTYVHLIQTFNTEKRFLTLVRPDSLCWLIREDIVSQAISVSRMVQTSVSHAPYHSSEELDRADRSFRYNPGQIRSFIRRIRWMERATEAMFARHEISPMRLSYEYLTRTDPYEFLSSIAEHVSAASVPRMSFVSTHTKIAGPKNAEFATRFREDHPRLVKRLARERASLIAALLPG